MVLRVFRYLYQTSTMFFFDFSSFLFKYLPLYFLHLFIVRSSPISLPYFLLIFRIVSVFFCLIFLLAFFNSFYKFAVSLFFFLLLLFFLSVFPVVYNLRTDLLLFLLFVFFYSYFSLLSHL